MYYVLGCFGPIDEDRTAVLDIINTDVAWQMGSRFVTPPPTPVEVTLNPDFPGVMVPMYDAGILLFTERMLLAIREAGVDNLDVYDAVVRDTATGRPYKEYKAVNIVGAIACADLGKSDYQAPSGSEIVDVDFDSLAIDESKTRGVLMFRLAECITAILVHEKVKKNLEKHKIPHLDFYRPEDWVG